MDRYTDFIEKMRGSHPQMPHPEEVTGRILERIQTLPQSGAKTVTALQKAPVIRLRRIIPALVRADKGRTKTSRIHERRGKCLRTGLH